MSAVGQTVRDCLQRTQRDVHDLADRTTRRIVTAQHLPITQRFSVEMRTRRRVMKEIHAMVGGHKCHLQGAALNDFLAACRDCFGLPLAMDVEIALVAERPHEASCVGRMLARCRTGAGLSHEELAHCLAGHGFQPRACATIGEVPGVLEKMERGATCPFQGELDAFVATLGRCLGHQNELDLAKAIKDDILRRFWPGA